MPETLWNLQKKAPLQIMWHPRLCELFPFQGLRYWIQGQQGQDLLAVRDEKVQVDKGKE